MSDSYITELPPVKRGDTWEFVFLWSSTSGPIELSNCNARMQIRNKRTKQLVASVSTEDDSITIDGPAGKVTATVPASITKCISSGSYLSDVQITFTETGRILSSQTVQIVVEEDITYD